MTTRVLLADDQPLLLQGFAMILNAQEDIEVVGEAHDGREAVDLTRRLDPDVVLMDVRMPVLDGLEATRQIVTGGGRSKVLVLTTFDVDEYAADAVRAGASGFMLKNARPEELLAGIRAVEAGDAVLAPSTTRRLLQTLVGTERGGPSPSSRAAALALLSTLTTRERDVFHALVSGSSNAEVAADLVLSETTVKTHVTRILTKLALRDRVHVVIFAYEHGLNT